MGRTRIGRRLAARSATEAEVASRPGTAVRAASGAGGAARRALNAFAVAMLLLWSASASHAGPRAAWVASASHAGPRAAWVASASHAGPRAAWVASASHAGPRAAWSLSTSQAGPHAAWSLSTSQAGPDADDDPPRILCVQAHPDDEVMYAAALYGIAQHLEGEIDVAIITDGSGGFDYAMLAEPIYGKTLAREPEARTYLPAVRKEEMLRGGEILGLRNVFFFDEYDHMYLLDADTVLQHVWDTDHVRRHLGEILRKGDYDAVFTLLPTEDTHGHHKSAGILALEAVREMPEEDRPVVLGALASTAGETPTYGGLQDYPVTRPRSAIPEFAFDRRRPLEVDSLLTYHVVVNWVIAEHKSQGTLQLLVDEWDIEHFWLYGINSGAAVSRARSLFERLNAWRP